MPHYIGLISGTSVDAVDAVLVDLGTGPPTLVATDAFEIPGPIRRLLLEIASDPDATLDAVAALDVRLGHVFGAAARSVLALSGVEPSAVRAIGSHGQTVRHMPEHEPPFTVQIGDPNVIAEVTGITTVADFRRRDVAAGGQGAPMVPPFHRAAFDRPGVGQVVLNLGGIANVTALPPDVERDILGFDTGPANALLDSWIARHRDAEMDVDGAWAKSGEVDPTLLERLLDDDYFRRPGPKSTGREYFNLAWLDDRLKVLAREPRPDRVQRTLLELTVRTVADAVTDLDFEVSEVLVCGGGALNAYLMSRLADALAPSTVRSTAALGLPPEWIEATAFAWLAARTLEGLTGNVPSVTGAGRAVILGGVYVG